MNPASLINIIDLNCEYKERKKGLIWIYYTGWVYKERSWSRSNYYFLRVLLYK